MFCNSEIEDYIESRGGKSIMTLNTHERASDRAAEALEKIEKMNNSRIEFIVMLQGDEPMINSDMIESALNPLIHDSSILVSNLICKINSQSEWCDPNEVKVVFDNNLNAVYFSREPLPSNKKYNDKITPYKQVCVIPFRRDVLFNYNKLEPTKLEIIESVDMNRFIEHGLKVKLVETKYNTLAVDTEADLKLVESRMKKDKLLKKYL